jgi:hypothetical protein
MVYVVRIQDLFVDTDIRCVELSASCRKTAEDRATREFTKRFGRQALRKATVTIIRKSALCGND